MGGGQLQLIAYGEQDIYLTGNPQITFFKSVYRRYTNFSMECIEQTMQGNISTNEFIGNFQIGRHGDLLHKMHFEIDLPAQTTSGISNPTNYCSYTNNTGHCYLKQMDLEIGGELIDRHYGHWYDIYNELYDNEDREHILINKHNKESFLENNTKPEDVKLYIPLHFWFCKEVGESLPLIALQYHHVELKTTFRDLRAIINCSTDPSISSLNSPTISLWANYIYLDTDERKRFAQTGHEYLIDQVQLITNGFSSKVNIPFNHSVKSLYWVIQNNTAITERIDYTSVDPTDNGAGDGSGNWTDSNDYLNFMTENTSHPEYLNTHTTYEHFEKAKITLNGLDRMSLRNASYFRTIQPYECEHRIPEKYIYMYSFCLKPREYQPSGALNFSKIDSAYLEFTGTLESNYTISVYALNYNVLRIMSGMGGLLYSS